MASVFSGLLDSRLNRKFYHCLVSSHFSLFYFNFKKNYLIILYFFPIKKVFVGFKAQKHYEKFGFEIIYRN